MSTANRLSPSSPPRVSGLYTGLLVVGIVVVSAAAMAVALLGTTDYDEGGYAYGGWLVWAQGWLPYRDFFTRVPPLSYYIYGIPQVIFGPSLLVARLTSAALAGLSLGLAAVVARRLAGAWAAVATVWLFAVSAVVMSYHFHAMAVGVTGCFVTLTLCGLTWQSRPVPGVYLAAAAVALMLLSRHDTAPVAAAVVIYIARWHPAPRRHRGLALALAAALIAAVMVPLYAMAPDAVAYMLTVGRSAPPDVRPQAFMIGEAVTADTVAHASWVWLKYRAGVFVLLLGAAGLVWWHRRRGAVLAFSANAALALALGLAQAMTCLAGIIGLRYSPSTLLYPFDFWPLAVGAAALFVSAAQQIPDTWRRWGMGLAPAVVAGVVLLGWGPHVMITTARPTVLQRVDVGARFIAAHTSPEDRIFTVNDPHEFLQARRAILPELFEAFFNFRDSESTAVLARLHLFNRQRIQQWLSGDANVAVISDHSLNWVRSSGRYAGGEVLYRMIQEGLDRHYELVAETGATLGGRMRIYRLKAAP